MKIMNNFQIAKFRLRVLLDICLIFCQFQPGVAYKIVAYKKACISHVIIGTTSPILDIRGIGPFYGGTFF